MRREDIKLVMEDLCSRVFHNPRFHYYPMFADGEEYEYDDTLTLVDSVEEKIEGCDYAELIGIEYIMLYLRPLSSMTKEEATELSYINSQPDVDEFVNFVKNGDSTSFSIPSMLRTLNWLNAHHFDYRGLIKKGLALEAPEDMYK